MLTEKNKQIIPATVLTLCLLLAGWATAWQLEQRLQASTPLWLQQLGADFTLHSADGDVSLHDFRGRWVLLYFGYTHCPDICPTALATIAAVIRQASEYQVAGLLISLDPRRDTPELLQQYSRFFHPAIQGITGSPDELKQVAARWRVSYHVPDQPADQDYAVDHTAFIYLVNPDGHVQALLDEQTPVSVFLNYIKR